MYTVHYNVNQIHCDDKYNTLPLVISSKRSCIVELMNGVTPIIISYSMTPIDHQSTGKPNYK